MNENNTYIKSQEDVAQVTAKPEPMTFTVSEMVTAFLSLLFGYGFIKLALAKLHPGLGATVFFIAFIVLAVVFLRKNKVALTFKNLVSLGVVIAFSLSFTFVSEPLVQFLNMLLVPASVTYWVYSVCYGIERIREKFCYDFMNSLFGVPFGSFGLCASGIASATKKNGAGKNVGIAVVGLVVAIPMTIVVASLLSSSDAMFEGIFSGLFENIGADFIIFIFQAVMGIPVAFYLYGLLYGGLHKRCGEATDEYCENMSQKRRFVPDVLLCSAVTPVCILYVMFFVAQLGYFLSAFGNILPEGYSYAEYARRGFFELFGVALINLAAITVMHLFAKKREGKTSKGIKAYTVILSAFTLMLIATAMSKMFMYISEYGLTPMRVYVSWFMILMAIAFVMIIIRMATKKFNLGAGIAYSFIIMMAVLTFGDVHGNIVRYNVYAYQSGAVESVDISMFRKLSPAAARYAYLLLEDEDPNVAINARNYIIDAANDAECLDIRSFNVPEYMFRSTVWDNVEKDDDKFLENIYLYE